VNSGVSPLSLLGSRPRRVRVVSQQERTAAPRQGVCADRGLRSESLQCQQFGYTRLSLCEAASENAFDSSTKVQFRIHADWAERFVDAFRGMDRNEGMASPAEPKCTFQLWPIGDTTFSPQV